MTAGPSYAVIIAARMSSTRLPGKALAVYCPDGRPNLHQIIDRWRRSDREPAIIVCASDDPADAPILELCARLDVPCFPAPAALVRSRNVLAQMEAARRAYAPDCRWIARALADNPLVDVGLADWRLDILRETGADGLHFGAWHARITSAGTTDIWSRAAWDAIAAHSTGPQLEHPGNYYWENLPKFRVIQLPPPRAEYLAPVRTELDTPDDLRLFQAVFRHADDTLPALRWIMAHPSIAVVNAHVDAKTQSAPAWPRGTGWACRDCNGRAGTVVNGDLHLWCPNCGRPVKFYANKPRR